MVRTHPSLTCDFRRRRLGQFLALVALQIAIAAHAQQRGVAPLSDASDASVNNGNYYALVIGINQYPAPLPQLRTAVNDAKAMAEVLTDLYGFHVTLLVDRQATRSNILDAIVKYRTILSENDSLLIYYGGHGYYDHDADKAYWVPADADGPFSSNRIIADDLTSNLKALPSRHVLIISDSCYSGGLSREANQPLPFPSTPSYVAKKLRFRSRNLMSSGGNEPVADNGPDGHSVFASAILKALERDDLEPQFTATDLFYGSVVRQVEAHSEQNPEYTALRNSSDDDGDFVFTRKGTLVSVGDPATAPSALTRSAPATAPAASSEPEPAPTAVASTDPASSTSPTAKPSWWPSTVERTASEPAPSLPVPSAPVATAPGASAAPEGAMTPLEAFNKGLSLNSTKQFSEALPLMVLACNGGNAKSCDVLGGMYHDGNGVGWDDKQALALYSKACDGGELKGCVDFGYLCAYGSNVERSRSTAALAGDQKRAVPAFRKACDGGELSGCVGLGRMYLYGQGHLRKDQAQAMALYRRACDGGEADGCAGEGTMYELGLGVAKDKEKAAALRRQGCSLGLLGLCEYVKQFQP